VTGALAFVPLQNEVDSGCRTAWAGLGVDPNGRLDDIRERQEPRRRRTENEDTEIDPEGNEPAAISLTVLNELLSGLPRTGFPVHLDMLLFIKSLFTILGVVSDLDPELELGEYLGARIRNQVPTETPKRLADICFLRRISPAPTTLSEHAVECGRLPHGISRGRLDRVGPAWLESARCGFHWGAYVRPTGPCSRRRKPATCPSVAWGR